MATKVIRKPASFCLICHEPNETTKSAIAEARSGKNPNKVYDNVEDLLNDLDAE